MLLKQEIERVAKRAEFTKSDAAIILSTLVADIAADTLGECANRDDVVHAAVALQSRLNSGTLEVLATAIDHAIQETVNFLEDIAGGEKPQIPGA